MSTSTTGQVPLARQTPATPTHPFPTVMRAARFAGPRRVELVDVAVPTPGPGEVLVRLHGCGVCASNLPVWQGRDYFQYPFAPGNPGHEGWGRIAALGQGVQGLRPGDLVACWSLHAYAEYDRAKADQVVPLSEEWNGKPCPAEAFGCLMNIFARSRIKPASTVVIIGAGFLGTSLLMLARHSGARTVALSRRPYSLELARQCQAHAVPLEGETWEIAQRVARLVGPAGADVVIETTGVQAGLDLATQLLRMEGRLVIAGYHQDGPRQINLQEWNWKAFDIVNAHVRDERFCLEGMRRGIQAVADGALDLPRLLTHEYPLAQLPQALADAETRPWGFVKGWVNTTN